MEAKVDSTPESSRPSLTEEIAIDSIRDFFRDKPFVVFGTGMSCAIDPRFGMAALTNELRGAISPEGKSPQVKEQWARVTESLDGGSDLENALDGVNDPDLLLQITTATGDFISSIDRECALKISNDEIIWPAAAFFRRLVDTLPEVDPILHVLTPNYDTLFEHACDANALDYTNGFWGSVERRLDWNAVSRSFVQTNRNRHGRKLKTLKTTRRHVRLYKVHGSLNFFYHRDRLVENNSWMWNRPNYANRVIVTPGLLKYKTLQEYRSELLQTADAAIGKANRFVFLGYGFNDSHLEQYIKRKLIDQGCRGLILTRDLNTRIESLLEQSDNLWAVCKLEGDRDNGARIYNRNYGGWLKLPTRRLWDVQTFTAEVLEGRRE